VAVFGMHNQKMKKHMKEQISQARKLDSIGTLAGGVAHNLNNVLTVIVGATALLELNATNDPEQRTIIELINNSTRRAAEIIKSLLAFSCRQTFHKQSENVGTVVKCMQDFIGRIIGDKIMLTTYLPDEPLAVMIDRGQIEHVLMNLAANARDAMPDGGILDIAVSRIENDGDIPELEGCLPGGYAQITVSDSGTGVNSVTQQRIFEPFFSTKTLNGGNGLGLSVVYGIINQHDGIIHVFSEPGEGTSFKIFLPLYNDQI